MEKLCVYVIFLVGIQARLEKEADREEKEEGGIEEVYEMSYSDYEKEG